MNLLSFSLHNVLLMEKPSILDTWSILYLDEWLGGFGGLCDFSVSPSPFGLDFGTLDFRTSDSGLTILVMKQR